MSRTRLAAFDEGEEFAFPHAFPGLSFVPCAVVAETLQCSFNRTRIVEVERAVQGDGASAPWPAGVSRCVVRVQKLVTENDKAAEGWRLVCERLPAHPNVLIPMAVSEDGTCALMPRMDMDLFSYLWEEGARNAGRIDTATRLLIAADVILAVDHMHSHGLAHRDIKPENILLEFISVPEAKAKGDSVRARLADFDFSVATRFLPLDEVAGTPRYFPASLLHEHGPAAVYDCFFADVYATCVVLIEILLRDPSWGGDGCFHERDFDGPLLEVRRLYGAELEGCLRESLRTLQTEDLVGVLRVILCRLSR